VAAARRITIPVLLIHGTQDTDTLPDVEPVGHLSA
jgi:pimeloyl-ACP methyl ester carboxylesterase